MKKFRFFCFICFIFLIIFLINEISSAQITNPIPKPVEKSEFAVRLPEIVQIPNSGTDQEKAARLNLLTHAGDGSGKLFVNDMRGKLYVIADDIARVYMNLKQLICADFTYESVQQGFAYFAFHPEFARNGIFYTVTSELKTSGIPDFPVTKPIIDSNKQIIESSHHDVIREWKATDPYSNTFAGPSREILRIEEPYPDHNVGQLAFNPNGTFWQNDELLKLGNSTRTALTMGHLPLSGDDGSLISLSKLACARKIFIHINNTNPILIPNSQERQMVEAAGMEVGYDGLTIEL